MRLLKKCMAVILAAAVSFNCSDVSGDIHAAAGPKLGKTRLNMNVGDTYKLKVKNAAKKAKVRWKMSKKGVVIIKSRNTNGRKAMAVISAVKAGKVTITATYKYGTKTIPLKCKVVVNKTEGKSDEKTDKATAIPASEVTETPKGTEAIKATETPKGTEASKGTEAPGATDQPYITEQPGITEGPAATQAPTKKPTAAPTSKPAATQAPTAKPTPTSTPSVSVQPDNTNAPAADDHIWVSTWGTAEEKNDINADRMPQLPLANSTVRQIIRVTTGGNKIKFRLSNQYGGSDVVINSMHIAKQVQADKSTIDTSTDTVVTVNGKESFTIPAKKVIETDGVDFQVNALENVAVSIYFKSGPTSNVTGHRGARATTYQVVGNSVSAATLTSPKTTLSWFFLADASILSPSDSRAVVCFGDSITDGYGTDADYLGKKPDSYTRWGDYFARRLQGYEKTKHISVINEGIGSNGMLGSYPTDAGKDRFLRDLTQHDGVGYCIILFGVNDLDKLPNTSKYETLKKEYKKMAATCHQYNIKVYAAPILPFGTSGYYNENSEKVRTMLNDWMRNTAESGFDGIIDFESAVWDPNNHKNILEKYTHSDGLHPYDGYEAMANAIDLDMFCGDGSGNMPGLATPGPTAVPTAAPTAVPTPTPLPQDKPYEFEAVTNGIPIDVSSYESMAGTGRYDTERGAVTINDTSANDKSQGTWKLPGTIPSIKAGDIVTFRVQGYNYGTSGFRFWIGTGLSGCSTPVMLVDTPAAGQLIDGSLGYPCEKDSNGNVLTPSTRNGAANKVTYNQMAIGADAATRAFDVTFSFKAGISQDDTNGVCSNLTLKYIMGGDTSGYINGLVIKNIYYLQ